MQIGPDYIDGRDQGALYSGLKRDGDTQPIPESAIKTAISDAKERLQGASSFLDIAKVFADLFKGKVEGQDPPDTDTDYQDPHTDYGIKSSGQKTREKLNAAAKEIVKRVNTPADLTADDVAVLKQYSGKGGLADGSQYEYYTPQHVAEGCWDSLTANGFTAGNVVDPCTGHGMFEATKKVGAIITGCDIDATSSKIAQLLNPGDKVDKKSLEELAQEIPDNYFDACVTNIPFGKARGKWQHKDPAYKDETYIHRYFIQRILDKLRPGGLAVLVCPIDVVGAKGENAWKKFRIEVSKKAEFLGAHKMPTGTFKAQGTDTVTDVVVFRKHSQEFLDKVESIPFEVLQQANVVWDEFVSGKYWQGEGRQYIMGKYAPKVDGDRWSRETVDGDVDDAGLKAKLAARFNSRIDWAVVDAAEPITRNYVDGDRKIMNGLEYELVHGTWQQVRSQEQSATIDAATYGAGTVEELKNILNDPRLSLSSLTAAQAFACWKTYSDLMPALPKAAIEFAMSQRREELTEQLWRGSLIGGMIGRYQAAVDNDNNDDNERLALQELVTAEIGKYGHPGNNKRLTLTGESSRMFGLFRNAVDEKGNFCDLLNGTLDNSGHALQFNTDNLDSIVSHLYLKEGIKTITLDDLKGIYTGGKPLDTFGDLAECEEVAVTPDGLIEPVSRYCRGDIYGKLDAMALAMTSETDPRIIAAYQRQMDNIMRNRKVTAVEDITFNLQQKWMPKEIVKQFLEQQGYAARYGSLQQVQETNPVNGKMETRTRFVENYDDPFGEWQLGEMSGRGYSASVKFGVKLEGFKLRLQKYLNGGSITDRLSKDDQDLIAEYYDKAKTLNEGLTAFMQTHPDVPDVVDKYNRQFNGFLPFDYDEGDLNLEGISGNVKLHTYQNAAVRRLSEEGSGILAFNVGLGKSFSALALCKYNQQMGRSKKTAIVVPSSVLSNWYHEAKALYGNMDDVLFVGVEPVIGKDGTIQVDEVLDEAGEPKRDGNGDIIYKDRLRTANNAEEVYSAMWAIPTSNHKIVVMSKDRFKAIPVKGETVDAYATEMAKAIEVSEAGQAELKKAKGGYGGAVAADTQEGKLTNEGTAKEKAYPYFEDMGFSDVICDEGHTYKNLMSASSRFGRVAYLPNPVVSQIGIDLSIKMAHIKRQNNQRGAYLLTATPITNSLVECWNMLSLVVPQEEFFKRGIYTVDDFILTYGAIERVDKLTTENEYQSVDGLTGYQNLDGLRDLFFKYCNAKSAEDVKELRDALPEADRKAVAVQITSEQRSLYRILQEQGKKSKARFTPKEEKRPLFAILRDMDKVTTDLDLFYNVITWHFPVAHQGNIEALVKSLPPSVKGKARPEPGDPGYDYDKGEEQQKIVETTIPLARSLKQEVSGDVYILVTPQAYEELVLTRLEKFSIPEDQVSHPLTPKYAALIDNCKKEMELGGKQLIFTEEKSQHKKLVRLIVHCIPTLRGKIGIINAEEASGNELQKISDSYNSGTYIYIVANRKAEVGVNLQKGTTAIHHMTFPWTKASMIQRDGRGLRQGNTSKKVTIYQYQGAGTFDMYRMDLIEHKGALIEDLVSNGGNRSSNSDSEMEEVMATMMEDNPEEAIRRIKEKAQAKAAADNAAAKQAMLNQFQAFASNKAAIAELDTKRETQRADLQKKIDEAITNIANWRARAQQLPEGDWQRKNLGEQISRAQTSLEKYQGQLATLDFRFNAQKEKIERNLKSAEAMLRLKANKGELPFDAALLDNPGNCLISEDGRTVIMIGDTYELKNSGHIIKITAVLNSVEVNGAPVPFKGFDYEVITGSEDRWGMPDRIRKNDNDHVPLKNFLVKPEDDDDALPLKVSYSEKELALKKALVTKIDSLDLLLSLFDKDTFQQYYDKINWGVIQAGLAVNPSSGGYSFFTYQTPKENGIRLAWPAIADEGYRKAVAEAYLQNYVRKNNAYKEYEIKPLMLLVFGEGWQGKAMEYGSKATQDQVLKECQKVLEESLAAANGISFREAVQDDMKVGYHGVSPFPSSTKYLEAARALGDNTSEINVWVSAFIEAHNQKRMEVMAEIKSEQEKAKMDAVRNHPNFKEIPENIKNAFSAIGITVKINTSDMVIPGKYGRSTMVSAFQKYYFQDAAGKNGVLYRTKEMLKAKYGAAYFADAGGEFTGSWWHVPVTSDLSAIYKLMA